MISLLVLFLVPAFASTEFPYDVPLKCGHKCVEDYQSGEQSACIRGCAISYVTEKHLGENFPTCEQTCAKEFEKSIEYVEACKKSCGRTSEPLVEDRKPVSLFEWIRKLLFNAYNKAKHCMGWSKGSDKQMLIKSDKSVENTNKGEDEHPFFITRIRIFQRIIPDDSTGNQDTMNPLMPMHHIMMRTMQKEAEDKSNAETESQHPDSLMRFMWSDQNSKLDQQKVQLMGSARVTNMFKHIIVSPLILSLFVVLLLLVSLITIKLVVQACHYRDARQIHYSRLPTYIEAVNVKIPYSDDDEIMEKKKSMDA